MRSSKRLGLASAVVAVALAALTGCAPMVTLEPAPDATNPDCAEVIVRLPDLIDDQPKRDTDAQASGAWGNPASILLRCGVPVPGPSTLVCYTVKNVDWLRDDADAPLFVFTTYGRDPAVEVIIDGEATSGTTALTALSNAVGTIEQTRACTNPDDVLSIPTPTPAPSN